MVFDQTCHNDALTCACVTTHGGGPKAAHDGKFACDNGNRDHAESGGRGGTVSAAVRWRTAAPAGAANSTAEPSATRAMATEIPDRIFLISHLSSWPVIPALVRTPPKRAIFNYFWTEQGKDRHEAHCVSVAVKVLMPITPSIHVS